MGSTEIPRAGSDPTSMLGTVLLVAALDAILWAALAAAVWWLL